MAVPRLQSQTDFRFEGEIEDPALLLTRRVTLDKLLNIIEFLTVK